MVHNYNQKGMVRCISYMYVFRIVPQISVDKKLFTILQNIHKKMIKIKHSCKNIQINFKGFFCCIFCPYNSIVCMLIFLN